MIGFQRSMKKHTGQNQQLILRLTCTAKGTDKNQQFQTFQTNRHSIAKIIQRYKSSTKLSLRKNSVSQLLGQPLQMHKPQINVFSIKCSHQLTFINTRIMYYSSCHFCLMNINFRPVKSPFIINNRHHKFNRKMHFQIQTLVTLYRIRSRMGFTKRIACKRFYLAVNFFTQSHGMSLLSTFFKKMVFHFLQSRKRTSFTTHRPSQNITISSRQTSIMQRNFNHIFLIHHDTIRFPQLLFKHGMKILKLVGMIVPKNIFFHHPRFGNSRSNNRRSRY